MVGLRQGLGSLAALSALLPFFGLRVGGEKTPTGSTIRFDGEEWEAHVQDCEAQCRKRFERDPGDAQHFCSLTRQLLSTQCSFEWTAAQFETIYARESRQGGTLLQEQPRRFRKLTDVGFRVVDIPETLLKDLRAFWLTGRLSQSAPENHPKLDASLSGCQSDTFMLHVNLRLQHAVREALLPMLAEWAGLPPGDLVFSSMYGLRLFHERSQFHMHVDRQDDLAISALLEVGHLAYGQPDDENGTATWPVHIKDHVGKTQKVPLRVGQMILYEGATCPKGRPEPFPGREVANLFVHFRPRGWPDDYRTVGKNPRGPFQGELWEAHVAEHEDQCRQRFSQNPRDLAYFCRFVRQLFKTECTMEFTKDQFEKKHKVHMQSGIELIKRQPAMFGNLTKVGFQVLDIPSDLFKDLRDFWSQGRLSRSRPENHPKMDAALTGCQSDTFILTLEEWLGHAIRSAVHPLLATWAGVPESSLEHTALYGLRLYHEGSQLHMHVDRVDTHVISAIMVVGYLGYNQTDDEDGVGQWPLHIYDHAGMLHKVPARSGQLILYESATCAHGRPDSFPGREMANVFVHFRPAGWPEAYLAVSGGRLEM